MFDSSLDLVLLSGAKGLLSAAAICKEICYFRKRFLLIEKAHFRYDPVTVKIFVILAPASTRVSGIWASTQLRVYR